MTLDRWTEQKILSCIDEVLDTLGDSGRQTLQDYFERNVGLKKEKISEKPEVFLKGLGVILGERGAKTIEEWIVGKLTSSFELEKRSNVTLAKAIDMIKFNRKVKLACRRHNVNPDQCKNIVGASDTRGSRSDV